MEKTKVGNMVIKEFLESKGVQLSRFPQFRQQKPAARRKILRMKGGDISVPVPRTNDEIRETLVVSIHVMHAQNMNLNRDFFYFTLNVQESLLNCTCTRR